MNWKLFFIATGSALVFNAATILLHTNYLTSVLLVMVGVPSVITLATFKGLRKRDFVTVSGFSLFSAVVTTGIEKLMIYYDVWNFSHASFRLVGIDFLGAPIEEYVYWWLSAAVVSVTYVCFARTPKNSVVHLPNVFDMLSASLLARYGTKKIQEATEGEDGAPTYLENQGTPIEGSHYTRGKKFPTWVVVASSVTLVAALLYRHFKGSWPSVVATVTVFFCVAYPNELYSLHNGLWVYNQQRIFGVWVLGVPVEEWFMYTMSPLAGGMLMSLLYKKFYDEIL